MISTRIFLEIVVLVLSVVSATPFFEHTQELNLDGVSDRVDVSNDFNTVQGGEMTFAFRATQKSIDRNYERAWDWSGSCGGQASAHVFADVYTSLRLTFQVYGLGTVVVDNFWELGVEHVYAFVVSSTHMKVYRDGNVMGALAVNGGISSSVRDQFYIGGSSCDCDQNVCSSNVHRWHANVNWFRVWTEALTETRIQDLNNLWKETPCTLAETTFTIDETIDGNSGAMSYFAIVNLPGPWYVFRQNPGTCSYKELHFGVNEITRKLYVGMCGVGTSETVAALPDGVNAIAMKYHAYGELEIWANGAKLDLGISQINGRAFSSSSTFQSSCSDQIKVYNRALSQNELETMTALTSGTQTPTMQPTAFPTLNPTSNPSLNPTSNPSLNPSSNPSLNPSSNPSLNPSSNPSLNPSSSPTLTPTTKPSKRPTAEDFIVKVKGFHGEPKEVLDSSKLQDQPEVDAEFFGFKHKWTPLTRRLLNRFYDVQDQGFGPEDNLEEQGFEEGEFA